MRLVKNQNSFLICRQIKVLALRSAVIFFFFPVLILHSSLFLGGNKNVSAYYIVKTSLLFIQRENALTYEFLILHLHH